MNICILPYAITDFVGTWAMPVGTPYRIGALGNQGTCIAQGFVSIIVTIAVPYYYSSLSVFSCFAVRNSFKEENYRHIEKWIHLGAIIVSLPFAINVAATKSINPSVLKCFIGEYPFGCLDDPNVPCERGGASAAEKMYSLMFVIITFIIPPTSLLYLRGFIKRATRDTNRSVGKKKIIETFRKRALKDLTHQSSLYLLSFWSTQIIAYIHYGYHLITGKGSYSLGIVGRCCLAFQGVVLMWVYLQLEAKKGTTEVHEALGVENENNSQGAMDNTNLTVTNIRKAAKNTKQRSSRISFSSQEKYSFHIFDGEVDESSPWAKFLNPDDDSEDDLDLYLEDVDKNDIDGKLDDNVSEGFVENDRKI